ncbi:MAG: SAM-dependent methyltransferase [Pseudomonadota bacterium]|nr:SAM-dependent methyltransferase [Pseudomonadota bacterium]
MRTANPLILATMVASAAAIATGCRQHPPTSASAATGDSTPGPVNPVLQPETVGSGSQRNYELFMIPVENPLPSARTPDVVYVPTPSKVVDAMLEAADVGPDDVLYDLGSGDGRIPITAAQRWGTRGVGVDIDPRRVGDAGSGARRAGVTDKVTFIEGDLFETELSDAPVITLYLLPSLNLRLRPTLLEPEPGTRIVSHAFDMGDWKPEQTMEVDEATVYRWTVPEKVPVHLR